MPINGRQPKEAEESLYWCQFSIDGLLSKGKIISSVLYDMDKRYLHASVYFMLGKCALCANGAMPMWVYIGKHADVLQQSATLVCVIPGLE